MKATIYLHIGPHKTGTTTIQKGLLLNEDTLRNKGVLVPRAGRSMTETAGHHNLAWELLGNSRFNPAYGTWEGLVREIDKNSGVQKVILSAEGFCLLGDQAIGRIKEALKEFPVQIVMYLRDQDEALQSSWVSQVRNAFVMPPVGSFREWLKGNNYKSKNTDYFAMIKRWENIFSKEALILSGFSQRFTGDNLFEHFLLQCGVSWNQMTVPENLNLSPGAKTIEAMRLLKNSIRFSEMDSQSWGLIAKSIMSYGDQMGWNQCKLNYLDRKLSRKIMKHHQQSNAEIEREYFQNQVVFESKRREQARVDKFTYAQFSKQETVDLLSFILYQFEQAYRNQ